MNQSVYYFLLSLGMVLIVSGFLCVGLTMYKEGDMPIAAPVGTIDMLESRKKICYTTGAIMIATGTACMAMLVYQGGNKIRLMG